MPPDKKTHAAPSSVADRAHRSFIATNLFLRKQLWIWPVLAAVLLLTIGFWVRGAVEDSQKAEVIKLRVFGGLKVSEIAVILHCSEKTVQRHWDFALAWLSRAFKAG
jgi:DNA-binding NarL/FixJ family response regulator